MIGQATRLLSSDELVGFIEVRQNALALECLAIGKVDEAGRTTIMAGGIVTSAIPLHTFPHRLPYQFAKIKLNKENEAEART